MPLRRDAQAPDDTPYHTDREPYGKAPRSPDLDGPTRRPVAGSPTNHPARVAETIGRETMIWPIDVPSRAAQLPRRASGTTLETSSIDQKVTWRPSTAGKILRPNLSPFCLEATDTVPIVSVQEEIRENAGSTGPVMDAPEVHRLSLQGASPCQAQHVIEIPREKDGCIFSLLPLGQLRPGISDRVELGLGFGRSP